MIMIMIMVIPITLFFLFFVKSQKKKKNKISSDEVDFELSREYDRSSRLKWEAEKMKQIKITKTRF